MPENFTRKPPKYERYIRPTGLRFKKCNVTHPELKTTFSLPILGVKKNPQSSLYTSLGVITKGTIVEVINMNFKNFRLMSVNLVLLHKQERLFGANMPRSQITQN